VAVRAVWGVVVAGGLGVRFGSPKQFARLGDQRLVDRAVAATAAACDAVVLVLPELSDWQGIPVVAVTNGGPTRSASVRAGLAMVPASAEIVVVHDAARPLASPALFEAVINAVRAGADAAVPGIAITDTLKRVEDVRIISTVERDGLVTVQTPQAFRAAVLDRAHASNAEASDDAGLVEATGGTVVVVPGDLRNIKVTSPADLDIAAALLGAS